MIWISLAQILVSQIHLQRTMESTVTVYLKDKLTLKSCRYAISLSYNVMNPFGNVRKLCTHIGIIHKLCMSTKWDSPWKWWVNCSKLTEIWVSKCVTTCPSYRGLLMSTHASVKGLFIHYVMKKLRLFLRRKCILVAATQSLAIRALLILTLASATDQGPRSHDKII